MNLRDFVKAVKNDELSNKAVKRKFHLACENIALLDADSLKDLVKQGFFDAALMLEADDAFGTEGMYL